MKTRIRPAAAAGLATLGTTTQLNVPCASGNALATKSLATSDAIRPAS
jgi:hypothetical protein